MYSCIACPKCLIPLEYDGNKEPKYDIYTYPKCGYQTKSQKPKMYFKTDRGWELVRAWPYQDEPEEILSNIF